MIKTSQSVNGKRKASLSLISSPALTGSDGTKRLRRLSNKAKKTAHKNDPTHLYFLFDFLLPKKVIN